MYKKATAIAVAFFVYIDLCTNIYKIKWHTDEWSARIFHCRDIGLHF